jgi:thiol-disulfide isomerase/thioredoxin
MLLVRTDRRLCAVTPDRPRALSSTRPVALVTVGALILLGGCRAPAGGPDQAEKVPPAEVEAPRGAPPPVACTAEDLLEIAGDGQAAVTVLNVWATWCVPCRQEMPDLVRLRRDLGEEGLRLLLVSSDFEETPETIAGVLTGYGVDFPTYLKEQKDVDFIDALNPDWQGAIPATFVYDDRGRLQHFLLGRQDHDSLVRAVRSVMRPRAAPEPNP